MLLEKIAKLYRVGFCMYRRAYSLWSSIILVAAIYTFQSFAGTGGAVAGICSPR